LRDHHATGAVRKAMKHTIKVSHSAN
jgi:hypothetical protein